MKILLCSDGSANADKAIRFGGRIALACQAEVTILGIAEKTGGREALQESLERSQKELEKYGMQPQLITEEGQPVREIARYGRENLSDLTVIGAAQKSNFWNALEPAWMSVRVYKIIDAVETPLLIVTGDRPGLHRILLCSSGDDYFGGVVEFAADLAQCADAAVDLFYVMPDAPALYAMLGELEGDADRLLESESRLGRVLRRQKELLEQRGVFGATLFSQGRIVPELLKALRQQDYDLVVSGSSAGAGALSHRGNLTRDIVNNATVPVLVMRARSKGLIPFVRRTLSRLFGQPRQAAAG